jgi:quinate dehydrogenase
MVIGAGGASRAAIHALLVHLDCSVVYLVNRDIEKAKQVVENMTRSGFTHSRSVIVVESVDHARILEVPFYGVGWVWPCIILSSFLNCLLTSCVPNNTPSTQSEKTARAIADNLFRSDSKGVFLDM